MAMKQLRRDNTGAGPRRCRSPPIVRTVVEGERRSPGSSSWRSSIRELPSLSQAGTGSRTMAPRGWRQRRKALWSGEAIVRNFEARKNPTTAGKNQVSVRYYSSITSFPSYQRKSRGLARGGGGHFRAGSFASSHIVCQNRRLSSLETHNQNRR